MLNKINWNKASAKIGVGVAGLLLVSGASLLQSSAPATAQIPPAAKMHRGTERHPEIRRAIRNLEQAKSNLQNAAHDFAGHREKALDLTNQALAECREALKSDKN